MAAAVGVRGVGEAAQRGVGHVAVEGSGAVLAEHRVLVGAALGHGVRRQLVHAGGALDFAGAAAGAVHVGVSSSASSVSVTLVPARCSISALALGTCSAYASGWAET